MQCWLFWCANPDDSSGKTKLNRNSFPSRNEKRQTERPRKLFYSIVNHLLESRAMSESYGRELWWIFVYTRNFIYIYWCKSFWLIVIGEKHNLSHAMVGGILHAKCFIRWFSILKKQIGKNKPNKNKEHDIFRIRQIYQHQIHLVHSIPDYLFKFLIIGSAGSGKSCLLHHFIESKCEYLAEVGRSVICMCQWKWENVHGKHLFSTEGISCSRLPSSINKMHSRVSWCLPLHMNAIEIDQYLDYQFRLYSLTMFIENEIELEMK